MVLVLISLVFPPKLLIQLFFTLYKNYFSYCYNNTTIDYTFFVTSFVTLCYTIALVQKSLYNGIDCTGLNLIQTIFSQSVYSYLPTYPSMQQRFTKVLLGPMHRV